MLLISTFQKIPLPQSAHINSYRQVTPIITYGQSEKYPANWPVYFLTDNPIEVFSLPLWQDFFFYYCNTQGFLLPIFVQIWEIFSLSTLSSILYSFLLSSFILGWKMFCLVELTNTIFLSSIPIAVKRFFA